MAKTPKKSTAAKSSTTAAADTPATQTQRLQRHPLSEKFSLPTTEEERLALGTDMKSNGQHNDIILYEGMVLDGWERYMGCLQMGLTPKFKKYEGSSPAAVAFGTNAIRRKLSSVQKALFGAKYFTHVSAEGGKITQKEVAKLACCSLERLNQLIQLLRLVDTNEDAARCAATLSTNPDVTAAALQTMLVDCGIIDPSARRSSSAPAANPEAGDHDDGDDLGADDDVDALGGADLDDLISGAHPSTQRKSAASDEGDEDDDDDIIGNGKSSGSRIGGASLKRPKETPASAAARTFRALTEPERIDFVKFCWATLRPAVEACMTQGRVEWPGMGVTADAGKGAMADAANALLKASTSSAKTTSAAAKPAKGKKAAAAAAPVPDELPAAKPAKGARKPRAKANA